MSLDGGGGNGYQADHQAILTCATRLGALQRQAQQIADLARTADPDVLTLGALGEIIWPIVRGASRRMHEHLDEVHRGLGQHATAMDCTAQTYRAVEDHHVQEFDRLRSGMPE